MAFPGGDGTVIIGYEAKVRLNDAVFGVKSGSIRYQADLHESGDTEKGEYKRHKAGRKMAEFSCEFSEPYGTFGYHSNPGINEGDELKVVVYRDGILTNATPDLIYGVVEHYNFQINLDGVCNGSISVRSDGVYWKWGEAFTYRNGQLETRP